MAELFEVYSRAAAIVTSVIVFLHVAFLSWFRKRRWLGLLIAPACAGLNLLLMEEIFSTEGMAALNFSAALVGMDLIGGVLRLFGKRNPHALYKKLKKRGLALFSAAAYVTYGLINFCVVRKTEYEIIKTDVPEQLTIALVSDSHLGVAMDDVKLISVIKEAASGADILVLAGDVVDERTDKDMFLRFAQGLKEIRLPRGMYFVFGNHDASRYGASITRLEMETALALSGVTVLTDESILIDDWLRIVGREDANRDRKEIGALLNGADTEKEFILLIDHQPAETTACASNGVDLLLSGHTHNGQIFPINIVSELLMINEIEYGHKKINDMDAVVSSGVAGWSSAFRTAGRSEYVLIKIQGAE